MFYLMVFIFVLGYLGIIFEHNLKINKAGTALVIGVLTWTVYALNGPEILSLGYSHKWQEYLIAHPQLNNLEGIRHFIANHELFEHLADISSILFFLLGAMTIVEVIDSFQGFRIITDQIKTRDRIKLLWVLSFLTFFMSAFLDNLTTTILMVTLIRKLLTKKENRWLFAGMIVVAANAGGAWSPIGDVTTIMLWIGNQITAGEIVGNIFLPSLVAMIVPLVICTFTMKGVTEPPVLSENESNEFTTPLERKIIFTLGILGLVSVPIFKTYTHLPPYLGMLLSLGTLWLITDIINQRRVRSDRRMLNVSHILRNLDSPTILFFLGILSAVSSLQSAGQLDLLAEWMNEKLGDIYLINLMIGFLSSVVDNVPLVAGAMGMYDIAPAGEAMGYASFFVQNGHFWTLLAYCAGTGGSIMIIGSAAGVAAMGMENISFGWYLKKIGWMAAVGYLAGAGVIFLENVILG